MKTKMMSVVMMLFVIAACNKKEPESTSRSGTGLPADTAVCAQEVIAKQPVKVGETGLMLPEGTRMCITKDKLEVRVELPSGYSFLTTGEDATARMLPVLYATYQCNCSQSGSACQVFYAEGLGFGCLQSSCTGSCTGKFTYKGYSVDKVASTTNKMSFFSLPEVQARIRKKCGIITPPAERRTIPTEKVYVKQEIYGVTYYLLLDKKDIPASMQSSELISSMATCNCEGTTACKLKTITIPLLRKDNSKITIYFCDGSCNGCELTVN